jgi:hypothetical protein
MFRRADFCWSYANHFNQYNTIANHFRTLLNKLICCNLQQPKQNAEIDQILHRRILILTKYSIGIFSVIALLVNSMLWLWKKNLTPIQDNALRTESFYRSIESQLQPQKNDLVKCVILQRNVPMGEWFSEIAPPSMLEEIQSGRKQMAGQLRWRHNWRSEATPMALERRRLLSYKCAAGVGAQECTGPWGSLAGR